jgi:hypothetical protein
MQSHWDLLDTKKDYIVLIWRLLHCAWTIGVGEAIACLEDGFWILVLVFLGPPSVLTGTRSRMGYCAQARPQSLLANTIIVNFVFGVVSMSPNPRNRRLLMITSHPTPYNHLRAVHC